MKNIKNKTNLLILTHVIVAHRVRHVPPAILRLVGVPITIVVDEAAPVSLVKRHPTSPLPAVAPVVGVRPQYGSFRFRWLVALDHAAKSDEGKAVDGGGGVRS